jgi:hypothetical protein
MNGRINDGHPLSLRKELRVEDIERKGFLKFTCVFRSKMALTTTTCSIQGLLGENAAINKRVKVELPHPKCSRKLRNIAS